MASRKFVFWTVLMAVVYYCCFKKQHIDIRRKVTFAAPCQVLFDWLKVVENRVIMLPLVTKAELVNRVADERTGYSTDTIQVTESIPYFGDIHFINTIEVSEARLTFHNTGKVWWGYLTFSNTWELLQITDGACQLKQSFQIYVPLVFRDFTEYQARHSYSEGFKVIKDIVE